VLRAGELSGSADFSDMTAMRLNHLGLPVRDVERSLRFYTRYFAFDPATATRYPDDTVILRNPDGFDLALHPQPDPGPLPDFLHFGFRLPSREAVLALQEAVARDGVDVVELNDEPDLLSFKCLDPDGFPVEVYWEP
jgi:catechol 2,3-dioxygenase-like lactoylglutathione lyase family enzyme